MGILSRNRRPDRQRLLWFLLGHQVQFHVHLQDVQVHGPGHRLRSEANPGSAPWLGHPRRGGHHPGAHTGLCLLEGTGEPFKNKHHHKQKQNENTWIVILLEACAGRDGFQAKGGPHHGHTHHPRRTGAEDWRHGAGHLVWQKATQAQVNRNAWEIHIIIYNECPQVANQ